MEDVLPGSASRNANGEVVVELEPGATVIEAVRKTSLKPDESYLVSVNDAIVLKGNRATHMLNDGDSVTILAPLRGG